MCIRDSPNSPRTLDTEGTEELGTRDRTRRVVLPTRRVAAMQHIFTRFLLNPTHANDRSGSIKLFYHVKFPTLRAQLHD